MKAWQKREGERQVFLEGLARKLSCNAEGGPLSSTVILGQCQQLLALVIAEMNGDGEVFTDGNIFNAIGSVDIFALTSEEAVMMKWQLIEKLLAAGFHDAESRYFDQWVGEVPGAGEAL